MASGKPVAVHLRPERPGHVRPYDIVEDRTHNGRKFRMLNVIHEFTRECLTIRIDRKLTSSDVIDVLSDLFILWDKLLNVEIFYNPAEARIVIEGWRQHYNTERPHSGLGYRPPAPAAVPWPAAPPQPATPPTSAVADKPTMH